MNASSTSEQATPRLAPEAFAERQKADLAYWKRMIDYTGIKVE